MKIIYYLIICIASCNQVAKAGWSGENRQIEAAEVARWEKILIEENQKPPLERSTELWLGLRNMGIRQRYKDHSPEVDAIYEKLKAELLSMPEHARYLAEEIERFVAEPDSVGAELKRKLYLEETLCHLPSPETILVLGRYLNDDRGYKPPQELYAEPPLSSEYMSRVPGNSHLACASLSMIGLRDAELGPPRDDLYLTDEDLSRARAWWEQVKSGHRTFSFKGQKVEYRFKPNGTWETLAMSNAPDDARAPPRPAKAASATGQVPLHAAAPAAKWFSNYGWLIIGGIIVLLATFFLRKYCQSS